jgi:SpoVK/Ycf46/Vps4 family AAA+-type ATPase
MKDAKVDAQKAANLWGAFARKFLPIARSSRIVAEPTLAFGDIGGLESAKEEILTYACAATRPDLYARWGTAPPSGIMLIGPAGCGKTLLAESLATQTGTPFVVVDIPRLILQVAHAPGTVGELLVGWVQTLTEMPRTTVLFCDLECDLARRLAGQRGVAPGGPGLELLLEFVDRTIDLSQVLTLASTSEPDVLSPAFIQPGRFERLVDVIPVLPDDVIAALEIHARQAEARASRKLFDPISWKVVVGSEKEFSIGDWVRCLHGALRKKARFDAAGETPGLVSTHELRDEVDRFIKARKRVPSAPGSYL